MTQRFSAPKSALLALAALAGLALTGARAQAADTEQALLAGGCFWCVEADFEKVPGVVDAVSGFAGGTVENPTYKQVTRGGTGHLESVLITYDPDQISYRTILDTFLRSIDPLDDGGQFCDRGHSYTPAIFALSDAQAATARAALDKAGDDLGRKPKVALREAAPFYPAEAYHQDYYKSGDLVLTRFGPLTKASAYDKYRTACGRDARIRQVWGDDAAIHNPK